ncbi:MAG TPA: M23 family metallopeptidase [Candidatus Paceibacterota bacterium]|nr:M23 family metallopeptidase [Candidatus Paceibacterota bacterium]
MIFKQISLGLMFIGALFVSTPIDAHAATRTTSYGSYTEIISHTQRSDRSRYSSAVERAIRKLDDDVVKNLPIPVLLGVSPAQLARNFGDVRGGGTRTHEGLDIMAPKGAFVASPTDAVVTRTGTGESAGIYVYTANPGGETFAYMHLDAIAEGVKPGTVLKAGDLIGYVGNTGNASGGAPHLHFEIRDNGKVIDPYLRLTKEFSAGQRIAVLKDILAALQKELSRRT